MKVILKASTYLLCWLLCGVTIYVRASEKPAPISLPDPDRIVKEALVEKIKNSKETSNTLAQTALARAMQLLNMGDISTLRTTPIMQLLIEYGAAVRAQPEAREAKTFENNILYTLERDAHVAQALTRINAETTSGVAAVRPCNFCKFAKSAEYDDVYGIVASFKRGQDWVKVLLNLYSYTIGNLVILTNYHKNPESQDCALEDIKELETRNMFIKAHALGVAVLRSLGIFDTVDVGFNVVSRVAGGSVGDHLHGHVIGHFNGEHTLEAAEVAAEINKLRKYPDIQHLLRDRFKEILSAESLAVQKNNPSPALYYPGHPECARCVDNKYILKSGKHWQVVVSLHPCKTGTLDVVSLHDGLLWLDDLCDEAIHELFELMAACTGPLIHGLGIHGFNMCITSGEEVIPEGAPVHRRLRLRLVARKLADTCHMTECNGLRCITQRPENTYAVLKPLFDKLERVFGLSA